MKHTAVFKLKPYLFGIPATDVMEIIHIPKLLTPPSLPKMLLGFVLIEEAVLPVICLSHLFDLTAEKTTLYTPLIIVKNKQEPIAFKVDEMVGIFQVNRLDELNGQKKNLFNDCVIGTFQEKGESVYLLHIENILLEKEKALIKTHRQKVQSRLNTLATDWY